jgi:hypothetical protein
MLHAQPIKQQVTHTLLGMMYMTHHTYLDSDPLVATTAYSLADLLPTSLLRHRSHFEMLSMVNVDVIPFPFDLSSGRCLVDSIIFTISSLAGNLMAQRNTMLYQSIPVNVKL